jgi:hypothetical protein
MTMIVHTIDYNLNRAGTSSQKNFPSSAPEMADFVHWMIQPRIFNFSDWLDCAKVSLALSPAIPFFRKALGP